jgi:hypothetical protein
MAVHSQWFCYKVTFDEALKMAKGYSAIKIIVASGTIYLCTFGTL